MSLPVSWLKLLMEQWVIGNEDTFRCIMKRTPVPETTKWYHQLTFLMSSWLKSRDSAGPALARAASHVHSHLFIYLSCSAKRCQTLKSTKFHWKTSSFLSTVLFNFLMLFKFLLNINIWFLNLSRTPQTDLRVASRQAIDLLMKKGRQRSTYEYPETTSA